MIKRWLKRWLDADTEQLREELSKAIADYDELAKIANGAVVAADASKRRSLDLEEKLREDRTWIKSQIKFNIHVALQDFYAQEQCHLESNIIKTMRVHMLAMANDEETLALIEKHKDKLKGQVDAAEGTYDLDVHDSEPGFLPASETASAAQLEEPAADA